MFEKNVFEVAFTAFFWALDIIGVKSPTSTPIIDMTIISSMSVKPFFADFIYGFLFFKEISLYWGKY